MQIDESVLGRLARIGADPNDDDELRIKKSVLVLCAQPFVIAALAWGWLYFLFDEPLAGAIPISYAIVSLLSIVHFGLTKRYRFFRFSQLVLILLLPFFVMVALGGFVNGSAVILWSLICPLGALLFDEPKRAPYWFLAFICLVVLSGLLQAYMPATNNLSPGVIILFFVGNLVGVGVMVFLMVFYFVARKNEFQARSESLLLNILPKEIVALLRDEQRTIADHYEGASILFADIVDFTPMSATMSPEDLVKLLNEVFSRFDQLVDKYGLEKIKTIGDCYMVAAGVPRARADHAQALTSMALEMCDHVNRHTFAGRRLTLRFGINSGPLVAGVIGQKKFIYDLWGEAVNMASRMQSHGKGGAVQISGATYALIKDEFDCEPRGTVDVKGKGETETWYVTGRKTV
ncbi:MAG: adenylate/guanylate cyclase domain-containing protein [Alphaproteobacteria bacterium]|jgi:guanylate cyclase|nr:adenylate/guanylate cyclase domain-containing protein [Alphaproteobacteria bacterium]